MRSTVKPPIGGAAWRSYHFKPSDPFWAPTRALKEVRRRLHAFDSDLNVWWSPMRGSDTSQPGRWRIVQWMPRLMNWTTVFYWETESGGYRSVDPVSPVLRKLARIRCDMQELSRRVEEQNEARDRARRDELMNTCKDYFQDYAARMRGEKIVVGPGHIRSRGFMRGRQLGLSDNHQRWLRSKGV